MPLLSVTRLTKLYGPDRILDGVNFKLDRGEHVALVGSNGSGKSTLLKIIAGLETLDDGQATLARNAIVTYVSQHAEFDSSHTLWDAMLEVFAPAREAQARMRQIEPLLASSEAGDDLRKEYRSLSAVAEHGGYDYESRIERVLVGLELTANSWNKPVTQLSGGQRTRANLARSLLQETDLLLLDEPTNHLDISAIEWLETYLRTQRTAFIVVAHDRYFLDSVSKRTMELSRQRIEDYPASYAKYVELRQARAERSLVEYERQQHHIEATEEFVRRFGAGQRSKEAKGRQKRLDRLERVERPSAERKLRLRVDGNRRKGDSVLRLSSLISGYVGHGIVYGPDELVVPHGARVAIVGPNGAGKTTLARTLIGQLPPVSGTFSWSRGSTPAYYAQATSMAVTPGQTVLDAFEAHFSVGEETARTYLGRFLFAGDEVTKLVADLSGGEQSRLALAVLLYSHPNVMLLDEPTNHLDIPARDALEQALSSFGGSLILISHDRYLIDRLATEIWAIEDGRIAVYDGNWADYTARRFQRTLTYSESRQSAVDASGPAGALLAHPPRPRRDDARLSQELADTQLALGVVLDRAHSRAATASVNDLGADITAWKQAHDRLSRLIEDLLEVPSVMPDTFGTLQP